MNISERIYWLLIELGRSSPFEVAGFHKGLNQYNQKNSAESKQEHKQACMYFHLDLDYGYDMTRCLNFSYNSSEMMDYNKELLNKCFLP